MEHDDPALSHERLKALYQVSRSLASLLDWTELVERMMDLVLETVGAERGVLFLLDEDGTPVPEVVRGADDTTLASAFETSRRILEHALRGEPVHSDDARTDQRFATESVMALNIVSFMCVPVRRGERTLGTLYVDHRRLAEQFGAEDLAFLTALADICAVALENARLHGGLQREVRELKRRAEGPNRFGELIGASEKMLALFRTIERVAGTDATVLIEGENGTGKELVARALHAHGTRAARPFVTIDCGTLAPELAASELFGHRRGAFTGATEDRAGLFEQAHGGTVFLDQIEDLPLSLQPHLLRAVQEGEVRRVGETAYRRVSGRLIAASRFDLAARVRAGTFREDLYYRLRVVPLAVPPLRERGADIPALAAYFLERTRARLGRAPAGFTPEALDRMLAYRWPGNVRELEHAIERAVLLSAGERIREEDLGLGAERSAAVAEAFRSSRPSDADRVAEAMRAHDGNVTLAARALGLTRRGLQKVLKRHGMSREGFAPGGGGND
jgi:transcriptional regulator with GAF, ATPase, and Fis domain